VRLNKKLNNPPQPHHQIKLQKAAIVHPHSPSKYDTWLTPNFNEISAKIRHGHAHKRTDFRMDDPCAVTPPPCDQNARCTTTGAGTYKCSCNAGYSGSGKECEEIDPCSMKKDPPLCAKPAKCVHTGPADFECHCPPNSKPNGNGCDVLADHSVQINNEAAQIALDGLKNLEDDKESQLEGLGRDQTLQDIQERIKDLIKTRRASLNDLQDQEIQRVERKVSTVEETTQSIAESEKKQTDLIGELKDELDQNEAATERQMREKAEQILDKAKDQVINAHRQVLSAASAGTGTGANAVNSNSNSVEYMSPATPSPPTVRLHVRIIPRERLYVVLHPETHIIPEYAPVQQTTLNLVPSRHHPGNYHVAARSRVAMVPVGVRVQQQQQQEVVGVQQQQVALADPQYIVPETRS